MKIVRWVRKGERGEREKEKEAFMYNVSHLKTTSITKEKHIIHKSNLCSLPTHSGPWSCHYQFTTLTFASMLEDNCQMEAVQSSDVERSYRVKEGWITFTQRETLLISLNVLLIRYHGPHPAH